MLTVVTNTRNERPEMLERCKASVLAALPEGAKHVVIPIMSDFVENRCKSFLIDEYVAVVDDDDYIHPESLKLCMAAIQQSGAGLAFTSEVVVDNAGKVLQPSSKAPRMYQNIAMFPREAHQLRILRTSCLDERALNIARKYGLALDWLVTLQAAFVGGAIHVPIDGYYWGAARCTAHMR